MEALQIIFANRKDCFEKPGGDTVQMMKTKEYLEKKYPVQIVICTNPDDFEKYPNAKIVHIFNLETINETNKFIEVAKKLNKKVVLSTIHWNFLEEYFVKYLEVLSFPPIDCPIFLKKLLISFFNIFILLIPLFRKKYEKYIQKGMYCTKKYVKTRRDALEKSDLLLPNSTEEMFLCADDFNLSRQYIENKSVVVPNATEILTQIENIVEIIKLDLPKKYVVIAGRIDSTKNQYNVVRALFDDKEIGIVIVGRVQSEKTYKCVKKLADKRGNVYFIPQTEQKNLIAIYKNAICHVLPSFYDTTGLVNLESLLCGRPIVVSNSKYCPVNFYEFDKYGEICDPYNPKSIRNAVFNIMNKKNDKIELSKEYKYKISYENVASLTYNAYEQLLG